MQKEIEQIAQSILVYYTIGLVDQLVALAAKSRQADAIAVAALDSHLKNLKFWS